MGDLSEYRTGLLCRWCKEACFSPDRYKCEICEIVFDISHEEKLNRQDAEISDLKRQVSTFKVLTSTLHNEKKENDQLKNRIEILKSQMRVVMEKVSDKSKKYEELLKAKDEEISELKKKQLKIIQNPDEDMWDLFKEFMRDSSITCKNSKVIKDHEIAAQDASDNNKTFSAGLKEKSPFIGIESISTIEYSENQWSPYNPEGEKKWTRDQLLMMMSKQKIYSPVMRSGVAKFIMKEAGSRNNFDHLLNSIKKNQSSSYREAALRTTETDLHSKSQDCKMPKPQESLPYQSVDSSPEQISPPIVPPTTHSQQQQPGEQSGLFLIHAALYHYCDYCNEFSEEICCNG